MNADGNPTLNLAEHGAQLYAGAASGILHELEQALAIYDQSGAGYRIQGAPILNRLLNCGSELAQIVKDAGGIGFQPVRAVLFDKNPTSNWALGWHQDRTICVRERFDVAGFGPWSIKQGLLHVEPPFEIMAGMLTIRVHLDVVNVNNAPLLIAPGSHKMGRIAVDQVARVVEQCGRQTCTAERGDVWLYATPIVHASQRSQSGLRRRVLQVDYSARQLPGGLEWSGI